MSNKVSETSKKTIYLCSKCKTEVKEEDIKCPKCKSFLSADGGTIKKEIDMPLNKLEKNNKKQSFDNKSWSKPVNIALFFAVLIFIYNLAIEITSGSASDFVESSGQIGYAFGLSIGWFTIIFLFMS